MIKCLKSLLDESPQCAWEKIVGAVTQHLISHRLEWKLYIKQKGVNKARQGKDEVHPICKTNEEGLSKSRELLAHMLVEAPKIVEDARSEARQQEPKKQNDGGFHGEQQDADDADVDAGDGDDKSKI